MELFKKKLEINNFLFNKNNLKGKKFVLKENLFDLGELSHYIPTFFEYLWADPKIIADILKYCDIKDIKGNLANLFINVKSELLLPSKKLSFFSLSINSI